VFAIEKKHLSRSGGLENTEFHGSNCTREFYAAQVQVVGVGALFEPGVRGLRLNVAADGRNRAKGDATPSELGRVCWGKPRVARASQPWAERFNPIGIAPGPAFLAPFSINLGKVCVQGFSPFACLSTQLFSKIVSRHTRETQAFSHCFAPPKIGIPEKLHILPSQS
jgi:hypothetical protein